VSPTLTALLWSWNPRPDVVLILASFGAAYVVGWLRLRALGPDVVPPWRLALYLGGLVAVGLALLSPVDALGPLLFFMHTTPSCSRWRRGLPAGRSGCGRRCTSSRCRQCSCESSAEYNAVGLIRADHIIQ